MKTIKRLSLSEQVVRSIVQYVQENNLQPGDQLPTENEFAESFGVSRTKCTRRRSKHLESTEC